jgi:preprotein translocase subunit SecG
MIFAAINWLSISINLLLVVFVVVCLLMALLILMQRPKQEGLGAAFGGGVTDQVFGARTTNVLQRGTVYLGSLFFILSLTLAILLGKQTKQRSLLEPEKVAAAEVSKADEKITEDMTAEEPKSLADDLPAEDAPTALTEEVVVPEEAPADAGADAPADAGADAPADAGAEAPADAGAEAPESTDAENKADKSE